MVYDPQCHHRRSIRLADYDYRQGGAYYVTVSTHDRECLFGAIDGDGAMRLSEYGEVVQEEWERTALVRANVVLDAFVVMPNHVHGILVILGMDGKGDPAGRPHKDAPGQCHRHPNGPSAGSLGAIIGQFKSVASRRINAVWKTRGVTVWHRNYYERIIRNAEMLDRARRYIANNPARWVDDVNHPVNVTRP